jgi:hypothetical protein
VQGQFRVHQDSAVKVHKDCEDEEAGYGRRPLVFNWDRAPVLTAATVQDCLAAMNTNTFAQPPYSSDTVNVGYILFLRVKAELAAISWMRETFYKTWAGVLGAIAKEDFVATFRR